MFSRHHPSEVGRQTLETVSGGSLSFKESGEINKALDYFQQSNTAMLSEIDQLSSLIRNQLAEMAK